VVFRFASFHTQPLDDGRRRGHIGVADPEADDIHALGLLLGYFAVHLGKEVRWYHLELL
jgi:hypothetical protein